MVNSVYWREMTKGLGSIVFEYGVLPKLSNKISSTCKTFGSNFIFEELNGTLSPTCQFPELEAPELFSVL